MRQSAMQLFKTHGVKSYANQIVACAKKKGKIIRPHHVYNFFHNQQNEYGQLIIDCSFQLIKEAKERQAKNLETLAKLNNDQNMTTQKIAS